MTIASAVIACLIVGGFCPPASALPIVSFQNITIDTGTIPGYVWGVSNTTPILVTATFSVASGTAGIPQTWGVDANFAWVMSGTTWSGNAAPNSSLTTTGSLNATTLGFLFEPVKPLSATVVSNTATLTDDANINVGSTSFSDVTLSPNTSATIATVQMRIAPEVRYGTYSFTFDDNPVIYGFSTNVAPDFDPVPYLSGGGLITVVPEPAAAALLSGSALAGAGYGVVRWRRRRHVRGLQGDCLLGDDGGEAARGG